MKAMHGMLRAFAGAILSAVVLLGWPAQARTDITTPPSTASFRIFVPAMAKPPATHVTRLCE